MAITKGMMEFSGKLGDFIFYKRNKKQVARADSVDYKLSENSIKSGRDFGEASRNATYIRKAFESLVKFYGTDDFHNRLNKRLTDIFKTIPSAHFGNKKLSQGNIGLLAGFEFNKSTAFNNLFFKNIICTIEQGGLVNLSLPKSELKDIINLIPDAEQAMLEIMLFSFDLDGNEYETFKLNDLIIDLKDPLFPSRKIRRAINHVGEKALIIAIGISYLWDESRSQHKNYFAAKISHAFHLSNGTIVKFIEPEQEKVVALVEDYSSDSDWELVDDEE
ncbi:hypothetical protein [Pedobacter sp.]|uniref:hypothetical protein n=1 Tax=Pedobacter sp. TaxID=1411316 RepID=UPI003BAC4872